MNFLRKIFYITHQEKKQWVRYIRFRFVNFLVPDTYSVGLFLISCKRPRLFFGRLFSPLVAKNFLFVLKRGDDEKNTIVYFLKNSFFSKKQKLFENCVYYIQNKNSIYFFLQEKEKILIKVFDKNSEELSFIATTEIQVRGLFKKAFLFEEVVFIITRTIDGTNIYKSTNNQKSGHLIATSNSKNYFSNIRFSDNQIILSVYGVMRKKSEVVLPSIKDEIFSFTEEDQEFSIEDHIIQKGSCIVRIVFKKGVAQRKRKIIFESYGFYGLTSIHNGFRYYQDFITSGGVVAYVAIDDNIDWDDCVYKNLSFSEKKDLFNEAVVYVKNHFDTDFDDVILKTSSRGGELVIRYAMTDVTITKAVLLSTPMGYLGIVGILKTIFFPRELIFIISKNERTILNWLIQYVYRLRSFFKKKGAMILLETPTHADDSLSNQELSELVKKIT